MIDGTTKVKILNNALEVIDIQLKKVMIGDIYYLKEVLYRREYLNQTELLVGVPNSLSKIKQHVLEQLFVEHKGRLVNANNLDMSSQRKK